MNDLDTIMDALYRMGWRGRLIWWTIILAGAVLAFALGWVFITLGLGFGDLQLLQP